MIRTSWTNEDMWHGTFTLRELRFLKYSLILRDCTPISRCFATKLISTSGFKLALISISVLSKSSRYTIRFFFLDELTIAWRQTRVDDALNGTMVKFRYSLVKYAKEDKLSRGDLWKCVSIEGRSNVFAFRFRYRIFYPFISRTRFFICTSSIYLKIHSFFFWKFFVFHSLRSFIPFFLSFAGFDSISNINASILLN